MRGIIFDIKKFAIHDGPGIRTTVFFKGCPLRCYWCHNPESISPMPQLAQFPGNCIGCGACLEACPNRALSRGQQQIVIARDLCQACGACAQECYAEALVIQGRHVTADEVMVEVLKDRPFYENSGGGMTLSGGEPMLQPAFAIALLKRAKAEGLHTVLDTCGHAAWAHYATALPYLDMVLFDLKCADAERHREATGAGNGLILANLGRFASTSVALVVRVPVIPDLNAEEDEMAAIGRLVAALPRSCPVELLPYHRLGEGKWRALGLVSPCEAPEPPTKETLRGLANALSNLGVQCTVGG